MYGSRLTHRGALISETGLKLRVGTKLKLPSGMGCSETLRIVERILEFDAKDRGYPLVNTIIAESSKATPAVTHTLFPVCAASQITIGQVISLSDPLKRGRVKVRLPWHDPKESIDGIWCDVGSTFMAGINDKDRVHGAWLPPQLYDWVRVLILGNASGSPWILGAVYRGNAQAVRLAADLQDSRPLFRFNGAGGSLEFMVHPDTGVIEISCFDTDLEQATSIRLDCKGNCRIQARQFNLSTDSSEPSIIINSSGNGGISISADTTTVTGKLNVKRG